MPGFRRLLRPFDECRGKRRSSREADVQIRQDHVESPTTVLEREDAHMEQREDQNPPSVVIEPPGEQHDSSLPDSEPSDTAIVLPEKAKASITPPECFWNEAYDSLKLEEPKLVHAYEKILSLQLSGESVVSMDQVSDKNAIQEENVLSSWITSTPAKDSHWSPCLQIIEATLPNEVDSSDTNLLILNHFATNVEVWDIALGKRIHVLDHTGIVYDAVLSSDSEYVLTVIWGQLIFWDIISGEMIWNIEGLEIIARAYKISKDGKFLVTCMDDEPIRICNLVDDTKSQLPLQHFHSIRDIKWSFDSKLLYIATDTFALLWDVARCMPKMEFGRDSFIDNESMEIVIWDLSRDQKLPMVGADDYPKEISYLEFSNDSTLLAMVSGSSVQIWHIATGQCQQYLNFGKRDVRKLRWSGDSQALVVIFNNGVELYDVTEHRYWDFEAHDINRPHQIRFSSKSALVATGGEFLEV
ncbi:hypothetical protein MKX08_002654 [Trichoderma sp. CBMAI-0020]|nr:hypothetical protein MKX08_002654 [Trichoderma sp. CBMAI-0020]